MSEKVRERSPNGGKGSRAGQVSSRLCCDRLGSLRSANCSGRQQDHPPEPASFRTSRYQQQPARDCPSLPAMENTGSTSQGGSGSPRYGAKDEHHRNQSWSSPGNDTAHTLVGQRRQSRPRKGKGLAQTHREGRNGVRAGACFVSEQPTW